MSVDLTRMIAVEMLFACKAIEGISLLQTMQMGESLAIIC